MKHYDVRFEITPEVIGMTVEELEKALHLPPTAQVAKIELTVTDGSLPGSDGLVPLVFPTVTRYAERFEWNWHLVEETA